ncbi:MAG: TlpA family protein disulfide reductase [Candidatus Thorarchaeota archaeon]|jgi:thiol-disulfide isomerase/thioredoxin
MEPQKLAVVSITLIVVVVGMFVGVSFLTFPPDDDGGHNQLTRTTQDTDLLELGLEVPDTWEFEMSDNTTLLLSDLRGQVVLVDLMTTWCETCKEQNSILETINENLAGTVIIISLSVDVYNSVTNPTGDTALMMAQYMIDEGTTWAHGLDTDYSFKNYFNIGFIPSMVLIDADGVFRYFHVSLWNAASLTDTISSIL